MTTCPVAGCDLDTPLDDGEMEDHLFRQHDEEELAAVIIRLAAIVRQHETCRTCGHERHEHDHDHVIRAQYCGRCTTTRDIHDFHPEEQQ